MARVKAKVLMIMGMRFVKREILRAASGLLDTYLLPPPNFIEIRLTLRCNLKCQQCFEWKMKADDELPTEFWKKTILNIRNYIGPYFIRFYGGEPFLRNDLLKLVHICASNNIAPLITTNGTLITKSIANHLNANKVILVNISLDGARAETHDALRGVKGTYQRVMKSIECLQGKVPIQLNTTIMNNNLDEILDLSEFAHRNNLQLSFQAYFDKKYTIDDNSFKPVPSLFPQDLAKLDYVIDELCRRKKYNKSIVDSRQQLRRFKLYYHNRSLLKKKHCEAVGARLMVKQQGDITLCCYRGPIGVIGNLREKSLKDIWKSNVAISKNKMMRKCRVTECLAMRGCYKESYLEKIAKVKRNIFSRL